VNFGEDIRKLREEAGMTQQELANRAGVSRSYIARLETTSKKGTVETLRKIFNVLDLDIKVEIVPIKKRPLD